MIRQNYSDAIHGVIKSLLNTGSIRPLAKWQGVEVEHRLFESLWCDFKVQVYEDIDKLVKDIQPDLPWAEDHFLERVGGYPTNPGNTFQDWPHYKQDENWREGDQFTHTYQQRIWTHDITGIKYKYGNLADLLIHLTNEPESRQAFLPIFFPEDTGAIHGGRVPCTLGYHFIIRDGYIHCTYFIRSLDVVRHFRNDLYMASRLLQWVRDRVDPNLKVGYLKFSAVSVHCFDSDLYNLKKKHG